MKSSDPIGIFDSGLGGLTVVKEIRRQMPDENLIFFGDSARNPYGTKSKEEVEACSTEAAQLLKEQGVKAIVIACNTATSAAAPALRSAFDFDIVGMEPALKLAADMKTPSKIAVWATALTLREDKFATLKERFVKDHEIIPVACPKLVELVENDQLSNTELVKEVLQGYLDQSEGADFIVLGCTHFVFFRDILQSMAGDSVRVVDGNEGTVRQLRRLLKQKNLLNTEAGQGSLDLRNSDQGKIEQSWRLYSLLEEQA